MVEGFVVHSEFERPSVGLADLPPLDYEVPSRSMGTRVAMFAGLVAALLGSIAAVGVIAATTVEGDAYATDAAYYEAVDHATLIGYLLTLPFVLWFFARMAPKVSYRSRDALFVFVPIWSYVFAARVLWRLTALQDRPWPHRPEEYGEDYVAPPAAHPYA